jgi:hypothetical protein
MVPLELSTNNTPFCYLAIATIMQGSERATGKNLTNH